MVLYFNMDNKNIKDFSHCSIVCFRPRSICSAQGTKNPLASGTGIVKPEVNIYCQGNGKGSNAGHLGGFKDTENQVGVVSSEIFQKEAGCAV